jgi:hypothetical protein
VASRDPLGADAEGRSLLLDALPSASAPQVTSEPIYAKQLRTLRSMSDADLEAEHEQLIATGYTIASEDYYRDELARRRSERATRTMVRLTWAIAGMTVVNLGFVADSVFH